VSNVQSVERAFAVLRCLAGGPAGVSEIAERIGLPKSTVSRLLATLQSLQAVEQLSTGGEYRVAALLREIAAGAAQGTDLIAVARPHLAELVAGLGETAGLSVLEGGEVHYLDQVASDGLVQIRDWTGERIPAHVVSSGLVLLAYADPGDVDRVLSGRLARFTARSVTDPRALRTRLAKIATAGTAWVYEEYSEELNSVAAPVRDASNRVVAAIHVHGPAYRFPGTVHADAIAATVAAAADRVSARLGSTVARIRAIA
jgi:DNA-binding IclR family transcriptional regulator